MSGIGTPALPSSTTVPTGGATAANQAIIIANQTNKTQQTQITDGTNSVGILKSDGTAAGQNAELVGGAYLSVSFTTTTVQAVGSTDAGNYRWVSVHIVTQGGSSNVTFQTSNDNTNWVVNPLQDTNNAQNVTATASANASKVFYGPVDGRYFRLNVTGIASGTTAGVIVFSTLPGIMSTYGVAAAQQGTWTTGNTGAVSGSSGAATGATGAVSSQMWDVASSAWRNLYNIKNIADGDTGANTLGVSVTNYNGTNWGLQRSILTGTNSVGTGITAAGLVAQYDNASPTTITENQFGNVRMSADRILYSVKYSLTPAQSSVASSNTNVTLLASNVDRKGATIFNDSTQILYLKLGATASTSSYTTQMATNSYYEIPFGYVGIIDGIWASANGNARITEIS